MATSTTFQVMYLGQRALIDTTQRNNTAENAAGILGTYGSANDPLYNWVGTLYADYLLEDDNNSYDIDNGGGYDRFHVNGFGTQNFDAVAEYAITLTYVDGTTAQITAYVFQDVQGHTFLAPETTLNADQAALTAKPIQSLALTAVTKSSGETSAGDMIAAREVGTYKTPVDGTTGNDSMGVGYTDAQGDQITNGSDYILAGAGNDTVTAGDGNDFVSGGTGADLIYGGNGNDSLQGNDGNDTIYGELGADTIDGGAGDDSILYGEGADVVYGGAGNDYIDDISGAQLNGANTV